MSITSVRNKIFLFCKSILKQMQCNSQKRQTMGFGPCVTFIGIVISPIIIYGMVRYLDGKHHIRGNAVNASHY